MAKKTKPLPEQSQLPSIRSVWDKTFDDADYYVFSVRARAEYKYTRNRSEVVPDDKVTDYRVAAAIAKFDRGKPWDETKDLVVAVSKDKSRYCIARQPNRSFNDYAWVEADEVPRWIASSPSISSLKSWEEEWRTDKAVFFRKRGTRPLSDANSAFVSDAAEAHPSQLALLRPMLENWKKEDAVAKSLSNEVNYSEMTKENEISVAQKAFAENALYLTAADWQVLAAEAARRAAANRTVAELQNSTNRPQLYRDRPRGQDLIEFLREEYKDKGILTGSFTRADLKKYDPDAAQAIAAYEHRRDLLPEDVRIPKARARMSPREAISKRK